MTTTDEMLTGIVLAGRHTTPAGTVDSLTDPYRGAPLFRQTLGALTELCDEIVIQVPADATQPKTSDDGSIPVRVAHDPPAERGAFRALLSALRVTWTELAVVVGGDQPDLSARVLLDMVRAARQDESAEAIVLREAGRAYALPCVVRVVPLRARAVEMIRPGAEPVPGLAGLFADAPGRAISEEEWKVHDPFGLTLRHIDKPGDLRL